MTRNDPTTPRTRHALTRRALTRRDVTGAGLAGLAGLSCVRPGRAQGAADAWRAAAPMPTATQEIYPALFDGRIYVAGGLAVGAGAPVAGRVGATDAVQVYDPAADTWSAGPGLDKPRHHPNLIAAGGALWSFGGFHVSGRGGWICDADVLRLDAGAKSWEPAAAMPRPRGETVLGLLAGRVHVVGGRSPKGAANANWRDHADVADHDVFDPASGRWESLRPAPTARNSHAAAVIAGRLYVVGGRTVSGGNRADLEVYDPVSDRWERRRPMPQAQGGLAAAALRGRLVAFGGEFFDNGGGVYSNVWIYDPATDAWRAGAPMPTPRHGLGAVTVGERVHVIGGAVRAGGNATSAANEVFAIA